MSYDNKQIIKFKGRFNKQFFPKNNKRYDDGEFAILTFTVEEELEGNIEVHPHFKTVSIKGAFPYYINDSQDLHVLTCEVEEDVKWGKQNKLIMIYKEVNFSSIEAQKTFLQLAGVTEQQIKNLYIAFDNPIDIIADNDIKQLCEVKGIGETLAKNMVKKYEENVDYSEAYVALAGYGMTSNMIRKLSDVYGSPNALVKKIEDNPYILTEVDGIGFDRADKIALASGINEFSPLRLRAFIQHILNKGGLEGYSWISSGVLVNKIHEELDEFPLEDIVEAVEVLKEKRVLWDGEIGKVALKKYYDLEKKIRDELVRIRDTKTNSSFKNWEQRVKQAEKLQGWEYNEQQIKAIEMIVDEQLCVITGKGGTGKTSTALGGIKALDNDNFAQVAFSGKASARMKEATGYPASTIHRLLCYSPHVDEEGESQTFMYNKSNHLPIYTILVDEFGMIGGRLFLSLLEAIPSGAKLCLLGDPAQLPAIGGLDIGHDLTGSPYIATTILTEIHRQSRKSAIITESLKVSNGEMLVDSNFEGKEVRGELRDLELDITHDKTTIVPKILEHFKENLKKCGDINEVQVIVSMNMRGDTSVYSLNNLIQPIYNPPSESKKEVFLSIAKDKGYSLRVGDKVINTTNNYHMRTGEKIDNKWSMIPIDNESFEEIPVFNGYVGEIIDIVEDDLIIYFPLADNKTVIVDTDHWRKEKGIQLAYAITIFKAQGSAFKYCICVVDYSQYNMLLKCGRELLYTMLTRASEHCTLVAENKALSFAIKHTADNKQTFMRDLLEEQYNN